MNSVTVLFASMPEDFARQAVGPYSGAGCKLKSFMGEKRMSIPARPKGFVGTFSGLGRRLPFACAKRPPSSARKVVSVAWGWSPVHSRSDNYYLSMSRSRTHWVLWMRYFESEVAGKYEYLVYAHGPKTGVDALAAAYYLLVDGWRGEVKGGGIDPPHDMTAEGLITKEILAKIVEEVWPQFFAPRGGDVNQS
jgi:hypothetical protein